jgi:uncharacterized protein (DUF1786 family)
MFLDYWSDIVYMPEFHQKRCQMLQLKVGLVVVEWNNGHTVVELQDERVHGIVYQHHALKSSVQDS